MDQTAEANGLIANETLDGPIPTVTYLESKTYIFSTMGGFLIISLLKAFLFRLSHPDLFYEMLAALIMFFIGLIFWFPPKLVLSQEAAVGSSFGHKWLDVPWVGVASIEMFQTPVIQSGTTKTGGRRALGFRIKSEFKGKIRPKSQVYGYDAVIVSMWNFSIDRVAKQCINFWQAKGGKGEIVNRLENETSHQLQLSS